MANKRSDGVPSRVRAWYSFARGIESNALRKSNESVSEPVAPSRATPCLRA